MHWVDHRAHISISFNPSLVVLLKLKSHYKRMLFLKVNILPFKNMWFRDGLCSCLSKLWPNCLGTVFCNCKSLKYYNSVCELILIKEKQVNKMCFRSLKKHHRLLSSRRLMKGKRQATFNTLQLLLKADYLDFIVFHRLSRSLSPH